MAIPNTPGCDDQTPVGCGRTFVTARGVDLAHGSPAVLVVSAPYDQRFVRGIIGDTVSVYLEPLMGLAANFVAFTVRLEVHHMFGGGIRRQVVVDVSIASLDDAKGGWVLTWCGVEASYVELRASSAVVDVKALKADLRVSMRACTTAPVERAPNVALVSGPSP